MTQGPTAPKGRNPVYETARPVRYQVEGPLAWIMMDRPQYHNAQNSQMTYALDDAFRRATDDDAVKVIILGGEGKHFSAGHDIGTPGRDHLVPFERRHLLPDHSDRPGAELLYTREHEVYLGMCRRWRDIPKPTIAMVQGACIAGGLMLAWVCDLIVASEDAYFQDPVNRMGIPGVEYFAHGFELPPRIAKGFLLLGEPMPAQRAWQFGMVNEVFPRDELRDKVRAMATEIATRPRLGNWLTKQALNHVEDLRGKRTAMDAVFHMHHFAHAQNDLMSGSAIANMDAQSMAAANRKEPQ
ncbi:enoyl-CoA hydratase [Sphingobium jiangsuense]|uniref:Enoyl-CoA hydratase n=1 Tax=Sphingobium jiangsuense TaxID=870476 RepID=A0A7W6BV33_9SPHN|nr:enoyl-CoA hydratase [Sphingobium jiangsuense]MBB3928404.1 enoyl-CoA hydratase [Sphingobium jiangsuense]GLS99783.1 enoyl-CoA hydratase [Sphingobium jiangsuense]